MNNVKILAFSGSSRDGSFNKKLVNVAAAGAREAGADVTVVDLKEFDLPLYTQNREAADGMHPKAREFKKLLTEHDGFLISSPENNSSYSVELKNAIDWASRKESDDERPLAAFAGKYATLMAASPGGLGGLRGLVHLRGLLQNMQVTVLPGQFALSSAHQAFDDSEKLKDEGTEAKVKSLGRDLAELLKKLR